MIIFCSSTNIFSLTFVNANISSAFILSALAYFHVFAPADVCSEWKSRILDGGGCESHMALTNRLESHE